MLGASSRGSWWARVFVFFIASSIFIEIRLGYCLSLTIGSSEQSPTMGLLVADLANVLLLQTKF
jgi:hypothetical protein